MGILLFSVLFFIVTASLGDASRLSQHGNNNIYKSIVSEDGDVIDCMDILKQPAFDHPKLKHHTIKMMPSYHPEGETALQKLYSTSKSSSYGNITQVWQHSGHCPEGTISVRRTPKPAKSTVKSFPRDRRFSSNSTRTQDASVPYTHEYAVSYANDGGYYGSKAIISAWQPFVEANTEFSLSQLWLVGGSNSDLNTIEVGWTVNPMQFGDSRTRLFVYWTADNYGKKGCWNLDCSGFVQISNKVAIGVSIYSAPGNHPEISLVVWKDKSQGVWWLQYNNEMIGYWPGAIYTNLNSGSASFLEWGGEIINSHGNGRHTATQMGSGQFASAGGGSASYFKNLQVVDASNYLQLPATVRSIVSNPSCYNIVSGKNSVSGYYFYYGGPGRNPNCP